MKLLIYVLIACLFGGIFGLVMASTRSDYNDSNIKPTKILDDIVGKANGELHEGSQIVVTKLDNVTNEGEFGEPNKLSGTLDSVRKKISYYVQWIAYIALAAAGTLIIYNGLLLVISPLSPDQAGKVKNRIKNIAFGIVLVTGFYLVLKILLAVYISIFVG